mmetsp:Transcript_5517/g.10720  ORF Transcript_5517/g.10720 Transcript_5517/m.10720 type:complete len:476 (-) Transcript_5517:152-1579(-)
MSPLSDSTQIRRNSVLTADVVIEDHSSSSRHEVMMEELDILRVDTNVLPAATAPLPSATSWRHYTIRLLQTGMAQLRSQWKVLLAGQILSFLTATTGAAQATLSFDCHLSAPTLTLGICYACLSLTLFYLVYEENNTTKVMPTTLETASDALEGALKTPSTAPFRFLGIVPLQVHPLSYLPMAIVDVYANYFTVLAFKYTTITSVTLFDALAIPSAMILSRFFLHRHYSPVHLLAVGSCIIGILLNVLEDYEDDKNAGSLTTKSGISLDQIYPHRTQGDTLAVLGGLFMGATNTYGEHAVRKLGGPYEYIGMMSFFAMLICILQTLLIERDDIAAFTRTDVLHGDDACSLATARWLLVGFTVATVTTYLGAARFLQISDAAFFNLSLLTGDLWSVIFSIVEEGIVPGSLFFIALVFIVSGVIVYEMTEEPSEGPPVSVAMHRKLSNVREDQVEMGSLGTSLMENDEVAGLLPPNA